MKGLVFRKEWLKMITEKILAGWIFITSEMNCKKLMRFYPEARVVPYSRDLFKIEDRWAINRFLIDEAIQNEPLVERLKFESDNAIVIVRNANALVDKAVFELERINRKEYVQMNKMYYITEKDLIVLSIPTQRTLTKEEKDEIKDGIKRTSGVKNVLVVEGEFHYISKPCEALEVLPKLGWISDGRLVAADD